MKTKPEIYRGLEGIYVDETAISQIDGEQGVLSFRGKLIEDLAKLPFSHVVLLLLMGKLPTQSQAEKLESFLFQAGGLTEQELDLLAAIPPHKHPMQMLQAMVCVIETQIPNLPYFDNLTAEGHRGLVLCAKIPALIASYYRLQNNQAPLQLQTNLSFHGNFLWLFHGKTPDSLPVRVLDTTQILQMEHGFNASTFAARVTASTLASVESAISAAIGTLSGKLHGGADQAALEMTSRL